MYHSLGTPCGVNAMWYSAVENVHPKSSRLIDIFRFNVEIQLYQSLLKQSVKKTIYWTLNKIKNTYKNSIYG